MYYGFLDRTRRTLGFRMTVWYSLLFFVSSLVTFGFLFFFVRSSVRQRDREAIQAEATEFASFYKSGGIDALKKQVLLEREALGRNSMLVRVAGPQDETLFFSSPDQWTDVDPDFLKKRAIDGSKRWIRLQVRGNANAVMEVVSFTMPDGSLLQVGENMQETEELLGEFRFIFLGVLIPMALLSFTGGAFLASRTLRPIRDLIHTMRSIEKGNMGSRVPRSHTQDELDELITLFNGMLERIETLIRGMKASLDDVAHDLRTPMTRLRGIAEITLQSGDEDANTLREALMDCAEESQRMTAMLNTLMDISEAETGVMKLNLEEVDLPILIADVVELYRDIAEEKNILLKATFSEAPKLIADANRVRQVIANLLDNAIKYTPDGGKVNIETSRKGQFCTVRIADTGEGIRLEDQPRIWDRLYRGDKSRSQRGMGLGLSLVKAVVHAHHGIIEVSSEPGQGSRFTISFPTNPPCPIEVPGAMNLTKK